LLFHKKTIAKIRAAYGYAGWNKMLSTTYGFQLHRCSEETTTSNNCIFTSTSNSWLCVNALLAQLALKQKIREGKKDHPYPPCTIVLSGFISGKYLQIAIERTYSNFSSAKFTFPPWLNG